MQIYFVFIRLSLNIWLISFLLREMQVIAKGLWYGERAYFKSGWNVMDGSLVIISLVDFCLSFIADGSPRIFGILRVFRLLRSLRPLRWGSSSDDFSFFLQYLTLNMKKYMYNSIYILLILFIYLNIISQYNRKKHKTGVLEYNWWSLCRIIPSDAKKPATIVLESKNVWCYFAKWLSVLIQSILSITSSTMSFFKLVPFLIANIKFRLLEKVIQFTYLSKMLKILLKSWFHCSLNCKNSVLSKV